MTIEASTMSNMKFNMMKLRKGGGEKTGKGGAVLSRCVLNDEYEFTRSVRKK